MIMLRLMGGLGNQMFQYAIGRTLASRYETELKLDLSLLLNRTPGEYRVFREYELGDFPIQAEIASQNEIELFHPRRTSFMEKVQAKINTLLAPPKIYLEKGIAYDPEVLTLENDSCLVGNFQSYKYFEGKETLLRKELRFQLTETPLVENRLKKIQSSSPAVALHVRRGDYVSNPFFQEILGALPLSYYEKGLDFLKEKLGEFSLWVFSDDPEWCKAELSLGYPFDVVSYEEEIENVHKYDMMLMSQCDHFLISNSTFAWWAAWLGSNPNKTVIAPQEWYKAEDMDDKDITPSNWIRM